MTSDSIWDPWLFDNTANPCDFTALPTYPQFRLHKKYDLQGEYIISTSKQTNAKFDNFLISGANYKHLETIVWCMNAVSMSSASTQLRRSLHSCTLDFSSLQRFFAWIPTRLVEHTFHHSTQYCFMPTLPHSIISSPITMLPMLLSTSTNSMMTSS